MSDKNLPWGVLDEDDKSKLAKVEGMVGTLVQSFNDYTKMFGERFDRLERSFERIPERVSASEVKIAVCEGDIKTLSARVEQIDKNAARIAVVEQGMMINRDNIIDGGKVKMENVIRELAEIKTDLRSYKATNTRLIWGCIVSAVTAIGAAAPFVKTFLLPYFIGN